MTKATPPRKTFSIRDPVHGYLEIAEHERLVIDDPITQRLRRITQTGLAELVFPEARTSRFVHSLGAMHLTSRFLISAIEHAKEDVVERFFQEILGLDQFAYKQIEAAKLDSLLFPSSGSGTGGLLAGRIVFRSRKNRAKQRLYKRLLALVEAGLRLAALFHDLGHLPFSHDFEDALHDYAIDAKRRNVVVTPEFRRLAFGKPHEKIGHRLADLVFRALIEAADIPPADRAAFSLARTILDHEHEQYDTAIGLGQPVSVLGWLHSLIDGELVVDRADYLLRDGRALGLDFASYDLDRLVANLKLTIHPVMGYVTVVDERGLSALESFLLTRFRSTQVLVRHHKTAQIAAALRYASSAALFLDSTLQFRQDLELLGKKISYSKEEASGLLDRFGTYDEPWWWSVLRQLDSSGSPDPVLRGALDLVLRRQSVFNSAWKRKGMLGKELREKLNVQVDYTGQALETYEQGRGKLLSEKQTLLVLHRFTPYKTIPNTDDSILQISNETGYQPASKMSVLIASLLRSWREDIHLHAFTLKPATISADELSSFLPPPHAILNPEG